MCRVKFARTGRANWQGSAARRRASVALVGGAASGTVFGLLGGRRAVAGAEDVLRVEAQLAHRLVVRDAGRGQVLAILEAAEGAAGRLVQLAADVVALQQIGVGQLLLDLLH